MKDREWWIQKAVELSAPRLFSNGDVLLFKCTNCNSVWARSGGTNCLSHGCPAHAVGMEWEEIMGRTDLPDTTTCDTPEQCVDEAKRQGFK